MDKTQEPQNTIQEETERIQKALLALGYFPYSVKFQSQGKGNGLYVTIEARTGSERDNELIGLNSYEQNQLLMKRYLNDRGIPY